MVKEHHVPAHTYRRLHKGQESKRMGRRDAEDRDCHTDTNYKESPTEQFIRELSSRWQSQRREDDYSIIDSKKEVDDEYLGDPAPLPISEQYPSDLFTLPHGEKRTGHTRRTAHTMVPLTVKGTKRRYKP